MQPLTLWVYRYWPRLSTRPVTLDCASATTREEALASARRWVAAENARTAGYLPPASLPVLADITPA